MERWLCARRTVSGDIEQMKARLETDTIAVLQAATGSPADRPSGDGEATLLLSGRRGTLRKAVSVRVGQVHRHGTWLRIPLSWRAEPVSALFPTFTGDLEVEDLDHHLMAVALIGRYRPPGSILGDLADRLAMARTADAMADGLIRGVAEVLGGRLPAAEPATGPAPAMLVADVMSPDPLVLREGLLLRGAASLLLRGGISGAPVVDDAGQVVGVLSEADLLDKVAPYRTGLSRSVNLAWRRHDAVTVGEACSRPARTTAADATLREAAATMAEHDVARLVVMRGATVAGILTRHDVIAALVRADEAIEDAIGSVLEAEGHDGITVDVRDGQVRLGGSMAHRSAAAVLSARVAELDGVLSVDDAQLTWDIDDVAVTPPVWM